MKKTFLKEIEAHYKTVAGKNNAELKNFKITSSKAVSDLMKKIYPVQVNHREAFLCLFLDRANKTVGFTVASIGGVSGTVIDAKIVFQNAMLCSASSVILVHNHPSGNTEPSQADIKLTKKLKAGGELLDIKILDHVIITEDSYYSFADEGII